MADQRLPIPIEPLTSGWYLDETVRQNYQKLVEPYLEAFPVIGMFDQHPELTALKRMFYKSVATINRLPKAPVIRKWQDNRQWIFSITTDPINTTPAITAIHCGYPSMTISRFMNPQFHMNPEYPTFPYTIDTLMFMFELFDGTLSTEFHKNELPSVILFEGSLLVYREIFGYLSMLKANLFIVPVPENRKLGVIRQDAINTERKVIESGRGDNQVYEQTFSRFKGDGIRLHQRCCHCKVEKNKDGLQCSGCKIAVYCDAVCQRAGWPLHRQECKIFQDTNRRMGVE